MSISSLPESFTRNVIGAFPGGESWLKSLPALVRHCEDRWQITCGHPFELSFNYVVPATTVDGRSVVLKLGVPNPELNAEIASLRIFDGRGAVRLLEADVEKGILLIERVSPGDVLASVSDDDQATRVAAQTMRNLWRPVPASALLPTVSLWAGGFQRLRKRFSGGTGPLPATLVDRAERLFSELLSSATTLVVLHGDLHHFNILLGSEGWVAVDPKGVIGEPAFEVAALLENPNPERWGSTSVQRRRIDILQEELGLDRDRMLGYGFAAAVLSSWWVLEDSGEDWQSACACAEALLSLMR